MTVGSHTDQGKPSRGYPLSLQQGPAQTGQTLQQKPVASTLKSRLPNQATPWRTIEDHSLFDKNTGNPETPGKTTRPSYLNILTMNNKRPDSK